jgi:hypothetical protein
MRPVGDITFVFEAVREAANSLCPSEGSQWRSEVLLRMLNGPSQSETGRQMARANPQYRR